MNDLRIKEKEVLEYLDSHKGRLGDGEFCRVSRNQLAKAVNRSSTSVWRTLRRLRKHKRLRTIYNYKTKENLYEL